MMMGVAIFVKIDFISYRVCQNIMPLPETTLLYSKHRCIDPICSILDLYLDEVAIGGEEKKNDKSNWSAVSFFMRVDNGQ